MEREWIDQTARLLTEALEPSGFTEDECAHLAQFLHDMDVETTRGGMTPSQRILRELIGMAGETDATANVLTRSMPKQDFGRLAISTRQARDVIGVSNATIVRYRHEGKMPPMIEPATGGMVRLFIWWLHHALYVIAWRRQNPQQYGQGATWWPDKIV